MSWLNGQELTRASATTVIARRYRYSGVLHPNHRALFWHRLAGPAGLPYNASGQLVSGGWVDRMRELQPGGLVLVGLMQDVALFGGVGQTVAAARSLIDLLGIPRSGCLLSPVSAWSETAPSVSEWQNWVSFGIANGLNWWLLDVTPYNRQWRTTEPRSRHVSVADYLDYVQQVSAGIRATQQTAKLVAPVYWDPQSEWGAALLSSLLSSGAVDAVAVCGLLPLPRSEGSVETLWAACVRQARGMLELRQVAPEQVLWALPVGLAVSAEATAPSDTAEYEPRNSAPFGAIARGLITSYLVEHGGFQYLAHWSQPVVQTSPWQGVACCRQDGVWFSSAGLVLRWLQRAEGNLVEVYGNARYLDSADHTGVAQHAPAGAMLVTERPGTLSVLWTSAAGGEPVQVSWNGVSARACQADRVGPPPLLTDPATPGEPVVPTLHPTGLVLPNEESGAVLAQVEMTAAPGLGDLDLLLQSPATGVRRADGIGDLDDLLVAVNLEHPSTGWGGTVVTVDVHSGFYYLDGQERYLYPRSRSVAVAVQPGWTSQALPEPPVLRGLPALVDPRGGYLPVYGVVRCGQPLSGQQVTVDGRQYWRFRVPGRLHDVRFARTLEALYPVSTVDRVSERSYWVSDDGRTVLALGAELVFDYLADQPSLWIEEYSWCEDGRHLLSRRIPYLPSAAAVQVGTGRVYTPQSIEAGKWRFLSIPPGEYLLRYLVDRSFCVVGNQLQVFSVHAAQAQLIYPTTDREWIETGKMVSIPKGLDFVRFVYLWEQPSPPQRVPVRLKVVTPELVPVQSPSYHLLLVVEAEDGMPVPGVWISWTRLAGGATIFPVGGLWQVDEHGRLLVRVGPSSMTSVFQFKVSGTDVSALASVPATGTAAALGYCEPIRLSVSDEYDLCLLRVAPPTELLQYGVRIEALTGWIAEHLVDTEPLRRSELAFTIPSGVGYSRPLFSSVGWIVVRVPPYPVRLVVTATAVDGSWRYEVEV